MRRLPASIREQVERDLRWYRQAREEVAAAEQAIGDLLVPATARWSHIGSQQGAPGNPTCSRGIAVATIRSRIRRDAWTVHTLDRWLPALHRDDRLLLALLYAMERDEPPRSLEDACLGARVPYETPRERACVCGHVEGLLWSAAQALGYRIPAYSPRSPRSRLEVYLRGA